MWSSAPWNRGLFAVTCPGLASWVQLPDPSLKPLLPRCWVLTASLSSLESSSCALVVSAPGASQADPFFWLLALEEGPVTFFSISHLSFKRRQGEVSYLVPVPSEIYSG